MLALRVAVELVGREAGVAVLVRVVEADVEGRDAVAVVVRVAVAVVAVVGREAVAVVVRTVVEVLVGRVAVAEVVRVVDAVVRVAEDVVLRDAVVVVAVVRAAAVVEGRPEVCDTRTFCEPNVRSELTARAPVAADAVPRAVVAVVRAGWRSRALVTALPPRPT